MNSNSIRSLLMAPLLIPSLMMAAAAGEVHTWTQTDGRSVTAEFLDFDGNLVSLRANDELLTVPSQRLSTASALLATECEAHQADAETRIRVLTFCQQRLGKKVGNGQCASLAVNALEHAGAKGMGRDFPKAGDYVWGDLVTVVFADRRKPVARIDDVCGGDIIQFRNARFEGRNPGGGTYWMSADHHTAVVESTDATNHTIQILHQNSGGNLTVRRDVLKLSDLKRGWLRIYRPTPNR